VVRKAQEGFPRRYRIVRPSEYRSVYDMGRKVPSQRFILIGRENELEHHRLGITVSRKVGNAVVRNRTKRMLREVFRKSLATIPNHFDLVVNARRGCSEASYATLREEFLAAVQKLIPTKHS
jgi:ribonuclease P protein component